MEMELTRKEMFKNVIRKVFVGDAGVWMLTFALILCSLIAIYSSTLSAAYTEQKGDFNFYLINQIKMIGLGFIVMIIIRFIPIKLYKRYSTLIFVFCIFAMILTLAVGVEINGAKRWLNIFGFSVQTSDFFKIGLFIYLSSVMWKMRENINEMVFIPIRELFEYKKNKDKIIEIITKNSIPLFAPIAIGCVLIMTQNMSTALILGILCLLFLLIGGVRIREIGKTILIALVAIILSLMVMKAAGASRYATWEGRVVEFFAGDDPLYDSEGKVKKAYILKDSQRIQSDIAIANGMIFGVGVGEGVQRSNLPNAYSDFIFSVIIEEWGLTWGIVLMCLYMWMFYRTTQIAKKCGDSFQALLCLSMGLLFCGSAFAHIAVCVGIFPVTGLTLPMISHGGTSIIFSFCILGIIQKISYEQTMEEKKEEVIQDI